MKDTDFLKTYRAAVRSYQLGLGPAARILAAVLWQLGGPPRDGPKPGSPDEAHRRIGT